jgi:hypothetical protein
MILVKQISYFKVVFNLNLNIYHLILFCLSIMTVSFVKKFFSTFFTSGNALGQRHYQNANHMLDYCLMCSPYSCNALVLGRYPTQNTPFVFVLATQWLE